MVENEQVIDLKNQSTLVYRNPTHTSVQEPYQHQCTRALPTLVYRNPTYTSVEELFPHQCTRALPTLVQRSSSHISVQELCLHQCRGALPRALVYVTLSCCSLFLTSFLLQAICMTRAAFISSLRDSSRRHKCTRKQMTTFLSGIVLMSSMGRTSWGTPPNSTTCDNKVQVGTIDCVSIFQLIIYIITHNVLKDTYRYQLLLSITTMLPITQHYNQAHFCNIKCRLP